MVDESIGSFSHTYHAVIIGRYDSNISLQTSETDSNVLGVENLSSSSEVIVRFILREVVLPKNTFKDRINPSVTLRLPRYWYPLPIPRGGGIGPTPSGIS